MYPPLSVQQDRHCTHQRNIQARSRNHFCFAKAISITYSEYVSVALGIQHAMRMRHIVTWPAPLYNIFQHYLIKGTIFKKKSYIAQNVCFDFLCKFLTGTFPILRRIQRDTVTNVQTSSRKVPVILVRL